MKEENQEGITKTQYRVAMGGITLASGAIAVYEALNYGIYALPQTILTGVAARRLVKSFLE